MNEGDAKGDLLSERRGDPSAREIIDALRTKYGIKLSAIKPLGDGQPYGRGGEGDIILATLVPPEDGSLVGATTSDNVAVKKIRPPKSKDQERFLKAFANELSILSKVSHTNIVKLIGFVEDAENWIAWFVFPWEALGNIREFILSANWEIPERISLIFDTLSGIEFMHTRQPPICHGDLKSLNVLVNSDRRALITDFGSARMLQESVPSSKPSADTTEVTEPSSITIDALDAQLTLSGPAWSLRWAAPEVLSGGDPGLASDMWAFAWICWEIMTGSIPFSNVNREPSIILHVIKGNLPIVRDDAQLSHIRTLCSMMTDCWKADQTARPNASECKAVVQWMPLTIPSSVDIASGPKIRSGALLYQMGEMYRVQDHPEQATSFFNEALAVGRSTGQGLVVAVASLGLGQVHAARLENSKAIEFYSQAMDIFVRNDKEQGQAATLIALGQVYDDQSEYAKATSSFQEALDIYTRLSYEIGRANALIGLGNAAGAQSRFDEAITLYIQARDIYIQIGHQLGRANASTRLGDVFRKKSELSEAKTYYEDAHDYYGRVGNELGIAKTLHGFGDVYDAAAEYEKASVAYEEAQQIFGRIGSPLGRANALASLMTIRIREGRFQAAMSSMEEAASIYESIGRTEAGKKAREVLNTLRQLLSEVEGGYQQ